MFQCINCGSKTLAEYGPHCSSACEDASYAEMYQLSEDLDAAIEVVFKPSIEDRCDSVQCEVCN